MIGELRFRQADAESQRVRRIRTDLGALQILKLRIIRPGADEQDERERDFRDDQAIAHALTS